MRLDGGSQDDYIWSGPRLKEIIERFEDGYGVLEDSVCGRAGVRYSHEIENSGGLQPGQVGHVPGTETVYADEGYPGQLVLCPLGSGGMGGSVGRRLRHAG